MPWALLPRVARLGQGRPTQPKTIPDHPAVADARDAIREPWRCWARPRTAPNPAAAAS